MGNPVGQSRSASAAVSPGSHYTRETPIIQITLNSRNLSVRPYRPVDISRDTRYNAPTESGMPLSEPFIYECQKTCAVFVRRLHRRFP